MFRIVVPSEMAIFSVSCTVGSMISEDFNEQIIH